VGLLLSIGWLALAAVWLLVLTALAHAEHVPGSAPPLVEPTRCEERWWDQPEHPPQEECWSLVPAAHKR
jgi:hypothetical protein